MEATAMSDDDKVKSIFEGRVPGESAGQRRARRRVEISERMFKEEEAKNKEAMDVANSAKWSAPPKGKSTTLVEFVSEVHKSLEQINLRLSAIEKTLFHIALDIEASAKRGKEGSDGSEDGN
jgi:hypothetical protein